MFYLFLHFRPIRCLLLVILRLQKRVRVSKIFIGDLDTIAESRKDDDVASVLVLDNLGPMLRGIHNSMAITVLINTLLTVVGNVVFMPMFVPLTDLTQLNQMSSGSPRQRKTGPDRGSA